MRLSVKRIFASHLVAPIIFMLTAEPVIAQGSIAVARDLYAAAVYDDALAMLNGLRGADRRPEEARAIEQYRALCLLALGPFRCGSNQAVQHVRRDAAKEFRQQNEIAHPAQGFRSACRCR